MQFSMELDRQGDEFVWRVFGRTGVAWVRFTVMRANFLGRRRPTGDQESGRQDDGGEARLSRIGTAMAVSFTVAVVGLVGLAWLAWVLLGVAGFRRHGAPSLHDTVGILQLVFASVAGAGALVALVVAYRRQKIAEADSAHDRTRVFNERFTTIAAQLGDAQPAVRLAGVHAVAGLADDWRANTQTCIDVLCAYLRMPYEPDPGEGAPTAHRLEFRANQQVRHTIVRVVTAHLRDGAKVSWQGLDLDFTGVAFDGGDFSGARFSSGTVSFTDGQFWGHVGFFGADFSGARVSFDQAEFSGGAVVFTDARFSEGTVSFTGAQFSGGTVSFDQAEFSGATVSFGGGPDPSRRLPFEAEFSDGTVSFKGAKFSGGEVDFKGAKFSGGEVDFTEARTWSHPPLFDWNDKPPAGVMLPTGADIKPLAAPGASGFIRGNWN